MVKNITPVPASGWRQECFLCAGNSCRGLTVSSCPAQCSFYKTEEQAKADERRARAILAAKGYGGRKQKIGG